MPVTRSPWREIVGNAFGFASAIGGLRRRVWAWPVGIVGNVLLFTVFIAATFDAQAQQPLFGQAGRQVFFIITSIYGWWRWNEHKKARRDAHGPAITPRWATAGERVAYVLAAVAGVLVLQWVFAVIGAGWPAPRWYYWCDAWIFVGSMLATYMMARGWNEFWLAWIAVDLVGVPLLWHSGYYPTAILFVVYGALVVYGFVVWVRASPHRGRRPGARTRRRHAHEQASRCRGGAGRAARRVPVLVTDDEDRENEGDVVLAAETLTEEWMAWTIRHTSGYICAPMPEATADRLRLPLMVADNRDPLRTAYTVTVDAAEGVTTGISAADRTHTVRTLADRPTARQPDPARSRGAAAGQGGRGARRPGHTEAAVDLCRLAGLAPWPRSASSSTTTAP